MSKAVSTDLTFVEYHPGCGCGSGAQGQPGQPPQVTPVQNTAVTPGYEPVDKSGRCGCCSSYYRSVWDRLCYQLFGYIPAGMDTEQILRGLVIWKDDVVLVDGNLPATFQVTATGQRKPLSTDIIYYKEHFYNIGGVTAGASDVYTCTECLPIEASVIEVYKTLVATNSRLEANEIVRRDRANQDHDRAETDHEVASADHQQYGDDHFTAGQDHAGYEADHDRAASDHLAASGDRSRAAADHAQAQADHTQAQDDHSRADNDHLRADGDHSTAQADHARAEQDHQAAAKAVLFTPQTLTEEEQAQARENIGVEGTGTDTEAVHYTPQSLTDAQKAQARTNIGAGTYSKPSNGIPASDLAPDVIPTIPTEVFVVTYGTTTQEEIKAAVAAGQLPVCKYGDNLYVYAGESSADYSQFTSVLYDTAYRIYVKNSTWGNGSYGVYSKPSGGIPSGDLSNAVQNSLGKADSAYQKPTTGIPANDLAQGVIPDVSQFITKSVNDLVNYYKKTETYNKTEVDNLIGAIQGFHYEIAASTSAVTNPQSNVLYLIGPTGTGSDKYEEYVYTTEWVKIGDTSIDLSGYVTTQALNTALAGYVTSGALETALAGKQDKIDANNKLDYSLVSNTPTVPTQYAGSPTAGGFANKAVAIPFGRVDSDSTATDIKATVDNFPTELTDGVCAYIRNDVVASASGFTLNINGTGAKPVYQTMADASRATTIFSAAVTYLFIYNSTRVEGGCWDIYYGYNSNDNTIGYILRTNYMSLPVTSACYRYRLLFTSADGTHFVPANASSSTNATSTRTTTQTPIDPFGSIRYYNYTSAVSSGARPGVTYLAEQYQVTLGYSFNRTGAALTLTAWKPVYIKCAPQADGSAIIDANNPYVQDLPTTADGKIYIFLGVATSATQVEVVFHHPVYYHDGTSIKLWTANPPVTGNGEDIDQNEDGKLQFANRVYNAQQPNGMGYKILRKDATFASQVTETNTIYEIRYDFSLSADVSIPANCELRFDGGRIVGGGNTITFNNTLISGNAKFSGCEFAGTILNGEVLLSWFTEGMSSSNDYSVDHTSVLVSAMKLASKNNNGWLNLERIPICIKQTIIITDEFGKIGMRGGEIFFVSTEDEQALFDYQERTSYSGSYSPIIDCKFTDVGDNYNTCVIKKTSWSDTAFTYWRDIRVSGFTGYFFVTNSYIQEVTFTNISVSGAGFFSTNSDGLYDGNAGSGNIIHFLNCNCNGGELNSKTSIRAIYDLSNCIEASLNNIVCQGRIGGSNIYPAYISHTSNITSGNRCNAVFDGFWVEYINGSGVISKIKCENVSANVEVRKSSVSVFDIVNSNVNLIIKSAGGGYSKDILEGLTIDNTSNVTLSIDSALYGETLVPTGDYGLFKNYIDRGILRVLRNSTPPYGAGVTQTGVSISLTPENEADLMQEYVNTITKSSITSRPFIHYLSSENNIPVLTIEQVGTGNYYEFPFLTNYQNYLGGNIDTYVSRSIWQEIIYRVTVLIDVTSSNLSEVYCLTRGLSNQGGGAPDTMIEPTVGMLAGESTGWVRTAFCRIMDGYALTSGGYISMRNCKLEIARLRIARRNVSINDDVYIDSLGALQTMRKMPRCFYMPIEAASDNLSEMSKIVDGGGFTVETPKNVYKYINGHLQAMLLPTGGKAGDRPTLGANDIGKTYFDTSLGCTIVWNGTSWVNLDGTELQWVSQSVGTLTTYYIMSVHTQNEGVQIYSTAALASPYLDVSGITKIRISVMGVASASTNYGIAFYDANKAVLAGKGMSFTNQAEDNNDVREITLPSGCSYVRTCIKKDISQTITFLTWVGN